jgi:hypothetical protein
MSGQHRRSKWKFRYPAGYPELNPEFRKLWCIDPVKLNDKQLDICLEGFKTCEAFYNKQENRDRGVRNWYRDFRRDIETEIKKRQTNGPF